MLAATLVAVTGSVGGPAIGVHAGRAGGRTHVAEVEVLGEQVVRPAPPPTSTPRTSTPRSSTSSTTVPSAPATPVVPVTVRTADAPPAPAVSVSCADALAYLATHQAPGFTDTCADGSAQGHLGYTCVNQPGRCEGERFIRIACPAPFVYMNEAHNSWVLLGERSGIDPYGQGSDAERAACDAHR